jgi:2-(1,2-epoxy-1,2-dihydrophenyl)acetyl-CoA isomerase
MMSNATSPVIETFDHTTGIGTLIFNRAEAFNALDERTAVAFEAATARLAKREDLRCVVLTGAGPAFMAGGDVKSFAADLENADRTLALILNAMHPGILTLRRLDAPILAAVNGAAAGAGLSLVLSADYVVAKATSRFVLAYDKLGVAPDCGGSWFLPRKVGRARAFELMLLGKPLNALEAQAAGIVNEVASDEEFKRVTDDRAAAIAAGATRAFGMFKALLDADLPLAAQLELEREFFAAATRSSDFRTAATSFVAKRPVAFSGR